MTLRAATYGTIGEAHAGGSDARRDVAAVRRLYRLHRELATDFAALERRRRLRADALMAVAVLLLALTSAFMVDLAPRCTGAAPPSAGLTIGDAIKVAGC